MRHIHRIHNSDDVGISENKIPAHSLVLSSSSRILLNIFICGFFFSLLESFDIFSDIDYVVLGATLRLLLSCFLLLRSGHLLLLAIGLDAFDGLVIEVGADAGGSLKVVVRLEELIELHEALAEVVHANAAIFVEIEAHVVVLDKDLDV